MPETVPRLKLDVSLRQRNDAPANRTRIHTA
jgi:hypothetical protein